MPGIPRKRYPTDLTEKEWAILEPLVPAVKVGGRPARWERRAIANAIFCVTRSGCTWRQLPHDFPPWQTVYSSFRTGRRDGTVTAPWRRSMPGCVSGCGACSGGRQRRARPSSTGNRSRRPQGGPLRKPPTSGYDGGKKGKGRKRHLLVDTQGLVLKVLVHAADVPDRDGGRLLLEALQTPQPVSVQFPRLSHLWGDAGYRGRFVTWVRASLGWSVAVVKHWWTGVSKVWVFPGQEPPEKPTGFRLLQWRWIVERTFAWIGFSRRMSKDDE